VSIEGKATGLLGDVSRGGYTRGDHRAGDHDLGWKEKYIPCGIVDEESGQLSITCGNSSKTSDGIVETLEAWWAALDANEQGARARLQITRDNGPESRGKRTQFLQRMVGFCDAIGKPIQLLYYPPYHSKYHPIERWWGIVEVHWNGTKLVEVDTMLEWAKSMTWKGLHPLVKLSRKVYQKGVTLSKRAMQAVEARLERHPGLPYWDILIRPASLS
jgi:Rhodopirellula transposase DDE domain